MSRRPEGNENPNLATGEIEVVAKDVEVLGESAPLPFQIDEHVEVGEEARLRHRYLDLRRPQPAAAMRLRSEVNRAAREVLYRNDFVEIETPTLTRSTPEGARDFVVPARLQPGSWYALPQSPQLFKQLLMVAGMERYFQIARCYRDEDFRADRQPEFTQLDVEMSFVDQDDVIELSEQVLAALWRLIGHEIPLPIPRITYADAMARYGTDKPDLRYGLELVDCTAVLRRHPVPGLPGTLRGRRRDAGRGRRSRARRSTRGRTGRASAVPRAWPTCWSATASQRGELGGPVAKNLSEDERAGLAAQVGAVPGDCVFFAAGEAAPSRALLGAVRQEVARRCRAGRRGRRRQWSFVWVVDAPLFEPAPGPASGDVAVGSGAWTAVHHAFTSPKPEWLDRFEDDPGSALAYAYDIVCNGNEIGGGSIRIHRRDVQERVFALMGVSPQQAQEKFGFLLEAFSLRGAAARRDRLRLGPDRDAARRQRVDPRRDRLPEVGRRLRPADRCTGPDHARAAQGGRRRRRPADADADA